MMFVKENYKLNKLTKPQQSLGCAIKSILGFKLFAKLFFVFFLNFWKKYTAKTSILKIKPDVEMVRVRVFQKG